jgi:ferric-dicitrate binding protein FerR (iron transport regulator)
MSASFSPIDPATVAALNAGGEAALEQIFREHYPWILERALERLKGERAAAPRLILATVRELWEERDGFHSSAELEAFFNEELRHRARAIRARLTAVHRFEKAEGVKVAEPAEPPTADQLWGEIAAALTEPQVDPVTMATRRRQHSSHELAEHISTVTSRGNWKTPAIIAGVATVIALGGAWYITQQSRATVVNELLGSAEAQNVTTRAGQVGSATLGDQSVAQVGPESRLVIVPRFGTSYRTLTASGTASFAVAEDGSGAFEARLGDVVVRSSGGTFAVRDYGDEAFRLVRATDGAVSVRVGSSEQRVASGEALYVGRDGVARAATEDEVLQGFAWTEGRLVLRNSTVGDAAGKMWRWYGLDVTVSDTTVAARALSLSVPLESSQAAIAAIEGGGQVRFAWVDGQMVFQPAAPTRARR